MNGITRRLVYHPVVGGLVVLVLISSAVDRATAVDFRIETKVYKDEGESPISESMTLFQGGVVYDFLSSPQQIAVFRMPGQDRVGRFVLLDPELHLRTELDTGRIAGALEKIRDWARSQSDPMLRFAAEPKFEESFDSTSGKLVLASYLQTYRVETSSPAKPDALEDYREFLDWYAQLNALHTHLPPHPRLALNEALSRHAVVPTRVQLTQAPRDVPVWAEHDFTWRLSQEDRNRIDEVRDAMASYRKVSNDEFLHPEGESETDE